MMCTLRCFLVIFSLASVAIAKPLEADDFYRVYRLVQPTPSCYNTLVSVVSAPEVIEQRSEYFLANEVNGKLISKTYSVLGENHFGVGASQDHKYVLRTLTSTLRDKVGTHPALPTKAVITIRDTAHVQGMIAGESVDSALIPVPGLIDAGTPDALIYNFKKPGLKLSFGDENLIGDTLLLVANSYVLKSLFDLSQGVPFYRPGQVKVLEEARIVLGLRTKDGILPLDVRRATLEYGALFVLDLREEVALKLTLRTSLLESSGGHSVELVALPRGEKSSDKQSIHQYRATLANITHLPTYTPPGYEMKLYQPPAIPNELCQEAQLFL